MAPVQQPLNYPLVSTLAVLIVGLVLLRAQQKLFWAPEAEGKTAGQVLLEAASSLIHSRPLKFPTHADHADP